MKIKDGVIMQGLQLPMRLALMKAEELWRQLGRVEGVTVTSALDGTHSAGSMHYYGLALDFRTYYFTESEKQYVFNELKKALSSSPYYVVLCEETHIHVHYLPTGL